MKKFVFVLALVTAGLASMIFVPPGITAFIIVCLVLAGAVTWLLSLPSRS